MISQRVTNSIAFLNRQVQFFILNYVDDFVSAELRAKVWQSYKFLTNLLEKIGVLTSKEKLVPPTIRLELLGVTFDMVKISMQISDQK